MKTGEYHSTQFEDQEVIYMTLLSQSGGTVRMRAEFNRNKESTRAMQTAAELEEGGSKWWENTEQTPEAVIESLSQWFQ